MNESMKTPAKPPQRALLPTGTAAGGGLGRYPEGRHLRP